MFKTLRLICCVVTCAALVAMTVAGTTSMAAGIDDASDDRTVNTQIEPVVTRTVAESGRTRVLAIRAIEPFAATYAPETRSHDPSVLRVVRPCEFLPGEPYGYIRVAGVSQGRTALTIDGHRIDVEVIGQRTHKGPHAASPRIVAPVTGAWVWGRFGLSVEVLEHPVRGEPEVTLRVGKNDDVVLRPTSVSPPALGPHRRFFFEVDTPTDADHPLALHPVVTWSEGQERTVEGASIWVQPRSDSGVTKIEAETPFPDLERPGRFGTEVPKTRKNRDASGGAIVAHSSPYPATCIPFDVPRDGWYQVIVRAAANMGGGALPSIGIVIDGANEPTVASRLVSERFHRVPIGTPVFMSAGSHVITPSFENDFYVPRRTDRNLLLDALEIASVDPWSIPAELRPSIHDQRGEATPPLRVGWARPLDGMINTGILELEGVCWWRTQNDASDAPVVTLYVNDMPAGSQQSSVPRFQLHAADLPAHDVHSIYLEARQSSGHTHRSPIQHIRRGMPTGPTRSADAPLPTRFHRFSLYDDRWDDTAKGLIGNAHYPKERAAAVMNSNATIALTLPEDVVGPHAIGMEAFGQAYDGPPVARIELDVPGGPPHLVAEADVPHWWDHREIGTVSLPEGPKRLLVSFVNDKYEQGKGDRNLVVQAITLRDVAERPADTVAPQTVWQYPDHDDMRVGQVDLIVADLADDRDLVRAELHVDGERTFVGQNMVRRSGRLILPLITRDLSPGAHDLTIVARDASGNTSVSPVRRVIVREPTDSESWTPYRRAVRMLNRLGYGPRRADLADILLRGEDAWLEAQLSGAFDDSAEQAALGTSMARIPDTYVYGVPRRVLQQHVLSHFPVQARFTTWCENHFSTWVRKTEPWRKWDEHLAFSSLGIAPFPDLLITSATSPAMLRYLDQETSFADRLNENYAREIMELHTLGVDGGYSQDDVTRLAHVLTGWTAAKEAYGHRGGRMDFYTFRFDPILNDGDATHVIGLALPDAEPAARFDRIQLVIETLASHPSTARFIAAKLAAHYVSMPAPPALVDDLTEVYLETHGDMREMIRATIAHPSFWETTARTSRMLTPLDYAMRLDRAVERTNPWVMGGFLERSGTGLFDRPTPDGYPEEDVAYADSNAMLQRWRYARDTRWDIVNTVPTMLRHGSTLDPDVWAQRVVDVMAVRITGLTLSPASNEAAIALLQDVTGSPHERVVSLAPFIAQLPEANMK